VNNQAAISIANEPVFRGKIKHFNITKAISKARFEFMKQKLGGCTSRVKEENC
jgi:O-glycosyl hydrolase